MKLLCVLRIGTLIVATKSPTSELCFISWMLSIPIKLNLLVFNCVPTFGITWSAVIVKKCRTHYSIHRRRNRGAEGAMAPPQRMLGESDATVQSTKALQQPILITEKWNFFPHFVKHCTPLCITFTSLGTASLLILFHVLNEQEAKKKFFPTLKE